MPVTTASRDDFNFVVSVAEDIESNLPGLQTDPATSLKDLPPDLTLEMVSTNEVSSVVKGFRESKSHGVYGFSCLVLKSVINIHSLG